MAITNKFGLTLFNENDLFNLVEVSNQNSEILDANLLPMWVGSREEYDAISILGANVLYFVKETDYTINLYMGSILISGGSSDVDHVTIRYTINYTADNVESLVKDYATVDTDEEATTE